MYGILSIKNSPLLVKLNPGDVFIISGEWLLNNKKFFENNKQFFILKYEYYTRPWYKFFIPKKLKSLTIEYLGDNNTPVV